MIAIEARNITKSFGAAQVLKGISLAARQGEAIAIIGASGSGKSTFLRCLNLLETPDSGEILAGRRPAPYRRPRHRAAQARAG